MATVETRRTRNGELSYRARVRILGYPERTATFDRKTDAKQWADRVESDLRRGRYVATTEAMRRTVAQMIDRYLEETLPFKARNSDQKCVRQRLTWWKEQIGSYSLASITPGAITDHKVKLARAKIKRGKKAPEKTRSASTVNHYLTDLGACFKTAMREWHWLEHSPVGNVSKMGEPTGRTRFLSDDERKQLLEACEKYPDLYAIVILALSTGMRRGEILGLRWPHVDLQRGVVVLHRTKNGERRALPLHGPALAILKERSKVRRLDTDRVFPNPEKPKAEFNLRRCWPAALAAAGITDFRFHDLRHSAASYLAMNGATLAELAEVLGHKTLAMVKRYSHLTEQHVSKVVGRMNAVIFKIEP